MRLYVIRHAEAVPLGQDGIERDEDRPLTTAGQEQSKRLAQALLGRGVKLDKLLSSPLLRAKQTAESILTSLGDGAPALEECEYLAPGSKKKKLMRRRLAGGRRRVRRHRWTQPRFERPARVADRRAGGQHLVGQSRSRLYRVRRQPLQGVRQPDLVGDADVVLSRWGGWGKQLPTSGTAQEIAGRLTAPLQVHVPNDDLPLVTPRSGEHSICAEGDRSKPPDVPVECLSRPPRWSCRQASRWSRCWSPPGNAPKGGRPPQGTRQHLYAHHEPNQ